MGFLTRPILQSFQLGVFLEQLVSAIALLSLLSLIPNGFSRLETFFLPVSDVLSDFLFPLPSVSAT